MGAAFGNLPKIIKESILIKGQGPIISKIGNR